MLLSYNIEVNDGDILIDSVGDNSIPWGLMDSLENLGAFRRYHIG